MHPSTNRALRPRRAGTALALLAMLLATTPAMAAQTLRDKRLFFGDAHWHSCLSQDADRETSLTNQYESMLFDYALDFSLESDHAEAASAGIRECEPYLPFKPIGNPQAPTPPYTGEEIADAMKAAADDWNGQQRTTPTGTITLRHLPRLRMGARRALLASDRGDSLPERLQQ